ncbi:MAG: diol dehydratase small subunit [Acidobacteriia bacterium]|nr:diol dehydratase small subunit [Terriglobia bacterium]
MPTPEKDPQAPEYPLAEKHADQLRTPSGKSFGEISLEGVLQGRVEMADLRVTSQALEWQAQIAERAGRRQLAENFRRAAELVDVPEERILQIYEALRPGRSSSDALFALAEELEKDYQASRCARLLREAAEAYARRPISSDQHR